MTRVVLVMEARTTLTIQSPAVRVLLIGEQEGAVVQDRGGDWGR
jgi:hypothetical protein